MSTYLYRVFKNVLKEETTGLPPPSSLPELVQQYDAFTQDPEMDSLRIAIENLINTCIDSQHSIAFLPIERLESVIRNITDLLNKYTHQNLMDISKITLLKTSKKILETLHSTSNANIEKKINISFIYNHLDKLVQKPEIKYTLQVPINNAGDPLYIGERGVCHGLCERWCTLLQSQNAIQEKVDWDALTQGKPAFHSQLRLSKTVLEADKHQYTKEFMELNSYTDTQDYPTLETLVDAICHKTLYHSEIRKGTMFSINLADYPVKRFWYATFKLAPSWSAYIFDHFHEARLLYDNKGDIQWFDPTVGGFHRKNENKKPDTIEDTVKEFKDFLMELFKLLKYDQKYHVVSVSQPFSFELTTKDKQAPKLDSQPRKIKLN